MSVRIFLLVASAQVFLPACSSTIERSKDEAEEEEGQKASAGPIDPESLGQPCSGGCGEGQSCALEDSECGAGLCGVDYRDAERPWLGCTADCSDRDCPSGYECIDVPSADTPRRACMPSSARLEMSVRTASVSSGAIIRPTIDATVPAEGGADGCGRVEVLEDDEDATKLTATLCTGSHVWSLTFAVPKKTGTSSPKMTVMARGKGYSTPDPLVVCKASLEVEGVSEPNRRKGSLTGTIMNDCESSSFELPLDGTFDLSTLPLAE